MKNLLQDSMTYKTTKDCRIMFRLTLIGEFFLLSRNNQNYLLHGIIFKILKQANASEKRKKKEKLNYQNAMIIGGSWSIGQAWR